MSTDKAPTPASEAAKKQRGQGVPVPVITLRKAVELMGKVWDKEKRNAAPVSAVMAHWGYGLKSSGGFQAIASLKKYGLLEEQGNNEKRTLKLTPLALDILKNSTLDLKEHSRLIKEAALNPKAHEELWEKYGTELPSDQTLESHLVFEKNFSESAAKAFISVYKDTIEFANLQKGDSVEEAEKPKEDDEKKNDEKPKVIDPFAVFQPAFTPPKPPAKPPLAPMNDTLRYLPIPLDIGDAPIPVGMSEDDFALLLETLQLWKKKIVKKGLQFPLMATWKNKDFDKPVTITAYMGETAGVKYYRSEDGTGIPETELSFG